MGAINIVGSGEVIAQSALLKAECKDVFYKAINSIPPLLRADLEKLKIGLVTRQKGAHYTDFEIVFFRKTPDYVLSERPSEFEKTDLYYNWIAEVENTLSNIKRKYTNVSFSILSVMTGEYEIIEEFKISKY